MVWFDNICFQHTDNICFQHTRFQTKPNQTKSMKTLYCGNFEALLRYGIILWGSNSETAKIFVIQKRIIRLIKKLQYRESCRGHFKSFGIMTLPALYIYECLIFIFKHKSLFEMEKSHEYQTRSSDAKFPSHRLTLTEKNPVYMCVKFYNSLPEDIRAIESQETYKKSLKKLLIELEPYSINEFLI